MNIATAISEIKTSLDALSWTSTDGTGTTTLQALYDYQNYSHTAGNPYCCIYETEGIGEGLTIRDIQFNTTITVDLCVNWSVIESQTTEEAKRAEANLRLREMWDYIKTKLFDYSFTSSPDLEVNPAFSRIELNEIDVYLYRITYNLIETIDRG